MKNKALTGVFVIVALYVALIGTIVTGYVYNIVWLVKLPAMLWNPEQVLSVVGIVIPPLGALMGYLH